MILFFFLMILFVCLISFLGLQYFDIRVLGVPLVASITSVGINVDTLKAVLGVGVVFSEFVVVIISMLDRIGETLRDMVKPTVRLIPFFLFLFAIWKALSPIIFNLLPPPIGETFGFTASEVSVTTFVQSGTFTEGILLSLAMMLLFVIAHNALSVHDSDEVRKLRAENAKLRKELRRGL